MSQDPKTPEGHPVPLTLEALEDLLESCKKIALIGILDELESQELYLITERIIELFDRFADRQMVEAFEANDEGDSPEIQDSKERIRQRLLKSFAKSDDPAQREIALKAMPTVGKTQ